VMQAINIEVLDSTDSVAQRAAAVIAADARAATARGRFVMAVSGGHTPRVAPGSL
jgi:6-phosphogluconolactonase/glucosamine-6-phosphate isomerase/deaminase